MHTVELLRQAIDLAERLGYQVRQEWLGGCGGGGCELKGRKVLFLDLALPPVDQLDQILDTFRHDTNIVGGPHAGTLPMPYQLRELLEVRKSA